MEGRSPTFSGSSCRPTPMRSGFANAMTIDVEDYFHVEAFASTIDRNDWDRLPRRVERNTERLLDILAGVEARGDLLCTRAGLPNGTPHWCDGSLRTGTSWRATGSIICGSIASRPRPFAPMCATAKHVLEDAGGVVVRGYRAPTFSISRNSTWAHAILSEEGYHYSSSVYPVRHDLYGSPGAPRTPFSPVPGMVEVPLTTVRDSWRRRAGLGRRLFPPVSLSADPVVTGASSRGNRSPAVFYLHPWEIDPDQPRQQSSTVAVTVSPLPQPGSDRATAAASARQFQMDTHGSTIPDREPRAVPGDPIMDGSQVSRRRKTVPGRRRAPMGRVRLCPLERNVLPSFRMEAGDRARLRPPHPLSDCRARPGR